jgi:chondroitin sulfate proteoglycan 4
MYFYFTKQFFCFCFIFILVFILADREEESGVGVKVLVMCSILMFIVGGLSAGGVWYFVESRRRVRVPGSPHYISSKQNPYVTVPLKEVHSPKRTPSFRGQPSPTPKLFAKSGGEYETATIKRNSHSLANGHGVRADLEQDKFF